MKWAGFVRVILIGVMFYHPHDGFESKPEARSFAKRDETPYLSAPPLSSEEIKLEKALALAEKPDQCHIVTGLLFDLIKSSDQSIAETSRYHLGQCLYELNLPFEASVQFLKIIESRNKNLLGPSIKRLIEGAPPQFEGQVGYALLSLDEKIIPIEAQDKANYLKAKYLMRNNQSQEALRTSLKVKKSSDLYFKSQFVASIAEYSLKEEGKAISRQKALLTLMKKKNNDKDLLALTQLNLARVYFQRERFNEAIAFYSQIPREHSLWTEASIELGWARLSSGDNVGAIEAMQALQSAKQKKDFLPESYVIKSLGYTNLCQFSEAYRALSSIDEDFQPWLKKVSATEKKTDSERIYKILSKHLQGDSRRDVEGYPFQILKELSQKKDFQYSQEAIKRLAEENAAYPFLKTLIAKDKKALAIRKAEAQHRVSELTNKIATTGRNPNANKNLDSWRFQLQYNSDFLKNYDATLSLMNEGEAGLTKLANQSTANLEQKRAQWRKRASLILQSHQTNLAIHLKQLFNENEKLKTEIYSRNEENMGTRLAKKLNNRNEKADRAPASETPDTSLRSFEFEKISFKSSLKNKCH